MAENTSSRIAVPTEGSGGIDGARSAHFGRADSFTLVDVVDGAVVGASAVANPPHTHGGCGLTVSMLADAGVDTAIVVGMGGGPLAAMGRLGIVPYADSSSPSPRLAVEALLAGRLTRFGGDNACGGH
jgi:predicted Fe-Mo cluster-binding NifX family protein